jgi:hypothetical protein
MGRFDVARVQVDIAGTQNLDVDCHVVTRAGQPSKVLTASLGGIAIYLYDLAAVRAFAAAWNMALRFVPAGLPDLAAPVPESTKLHVGLLVHLAGTPDRRRINGVAASVSPSGKPFVRVEVGVLQMHAHDLTAIRTAAESWTGIEKLARRTWPNLDAFDEVDVRDRARIARTGKVAKRMEGDNG